MPASGPWSRILSAARWRALYFAQQRYEADFRFSLARLREYGEQVALLAGEPVEERSRDAALQRGSSAITWRSSNAASNS